MNTPKPFVEAGILVLDLIHDQSHRLTERQCWSIRELMKTLLRKKVKAVLDQVRILTRELPDGQPRNPNSCYNFIPDLKTAMEKLGAVTPPAEKASEHEITPFDIDQLRGRVEGLIDLFGDKPVTEPPEPDESSDTKGPLSEKDLQRLLLDIRKHVSTGETPTTRKKFIRHLGRG